MTRKKLAKIEERHARARRSPQKASVLEGLASQLGRKLVDRGKEPTWENTVFPHLRPLAIPRHGSRDLSPRVKKIVLNQLEDDISAWKEFYLKEDDHDETDQPDDD